MKPYVIPITDDIYLKRIDYSKVRKQLNSKYSSISMLKKKEKRVRTHMNLKSLTRISERNIPTFRLKSNFTKARRKGFLPEQ